MKLIHNEDFDPKLVEGKTIATVKVEPNPKGNDSITVVFTDGTKWGITGGWCNDSTAALDHTLETPTCS